MTLESLVWLATGTLAGIMGTLTAVAIHKWREGHPRPLKHDPTLERLRRLQQVPRHGSNMLPDLHLPPDHDAPSPMRTSDLKDGS